MEPSAARVRLQKFLSDAGVASRRRAEELILAGRVLVNDDVVQTLPAFVDPLRDRVIVDGRRIRVPEREYFVLHKPKGFICSSRDPGGRRCVSELLPDGLPPLFSAGRLDADATGLLLLTNDGEWALRVTHPRYGVLKTYRAEVRGRVAPEAVGRLRKGIFVDAGRARADFVEILHVGSDRSVIEIGMTDSRNRSLRPMLARLGHPLKKLMRTRVGALELKGLPVGACRRLAPHEVESLGQPSASRRRPAVVPSRTRAVGTPSPARPRRPTDGARTADSQGGRPAARAASAQRTRAESRPDTRSRKPPTPRWRKGPPPR